MKKYLVIIIFAGILIFPWMSYASGGWALNQEGNQFSVHGGCDAGQVRIELFKKAGDTDAVYATKTECTGGTFSFVTNFSKLHIPEGSYIIAIDGQKSQSTVAVMKENDASDDTPLEAPTRLPVENPEIKFLSAFVAVQQSILDMHNWLAQTSYPAIIKSGLGIALDGVDVAVGKVSELVMSIEDRNTAADAKIIDQATPAQAISTHAVPTTDTSLDVQASTPPVESDFSTENATLQATTPNADSAVNAISIDTENEGLTVSDPDAQ